MQIVVCNGLCRYHKKALGYNFWAHISRRCDHKPCLWPLVCEPFSLLLPLIFFFKLKNVSSLLHLLGVRYIYS